MRKDKNGKITPEYNAWQAAKERCHNKKIWSYRRYGGRGIKMCEKWRNNFAAFLKDMGPRPTDKHTLNRKNNDRNYTPSNCEWATQKDQMKNTSDAIYITIMGRTMHMTEWADFFNISYGVMQSRIWDYQFRDAQLRWLWQEFKRLDAIVPNDFKVPSGCRHVKIDTRKPESTLGIVWLALKTGPITVGAIQQRTPVDDSCIVRALHKVGAIKMTRQKGGRYSSAPAVYTLKGVKEL